MEDFIASIYQYVYITIIAILSISIISAYKLHRGSFEYHYPIKRTNEILLVVFLIVFIGLRPISESVFFDMTAYAKFYYQYEGNAFEFNWNTDNKIFDNLYLFWSSAKLGATNLFLFLATLYFGCSYIGIRKLFPKHTLPAYLVFLAAFSTFSYATNGMKAGVAASIFIMALGFRHKIWLSLIFAIVSLGFHHSMVLPIAGFIVTMIIKKPKWYFYGWFFCLLMATLHITYFQNLFGGMTDDQGAGYLLVTTDNTLGGIRFRPDFILYSAMPVWIGYQFEMKKKITSKIYSSLLHFYLVTNGIWMLCMYASFNNRIAYLSWFVYPIVLIYPFLYVDNSKEKYVKFSKSVKYHLLFTLFMEFVYYGILSLGH